MANPVVILALLTDRLLVTMNHQIPPTRPLSMKMRHLIMRREAALKCGLWFLATGVEQTNNGSGLK
jgi:hypothetical protein